jgi:peptidoglycan hydrolase-like protein with peptidoglycan-binding domain
MKTKTIESLQRWLKAKRFNPGAIDGIDGPNTFDAWSAYLAANDQAANGASNTKEERHAN